MWKRIKSSSGWLWTLAILITLASVYYQRKTGPTYPVNGSIQIQNEFVEYTLPRSHDTGQDAEIELENVDQKLQGIIRWRRYQSNDPWQEKSLDYHDGSLVTTLPQQPAAGKVMYQISLTDSEGNTIYLTEEPVIMRFKGSVPAGILVPHIFLMFFAMLIGNRTGLEALARRENSYRYSILTLILLSIGGLILGPVVQKYAFDAFWTGWPFGHDLTDNKTLLAVIMWGLALWKGRGSNLDRGRKWMIAAAIVQLAVYLIPHSVLGSELDYTQRGESADMLGDIVK